MKPKKIILAIALIASSIGLAVFAQSYPNLTNDEELALNAIKHQMEIAAGSEYKYRSDGQTVQNQVYIDTNGKKVWSLHKANDAIGGLVKKNRLFVWWNGIN